MADAVIVFTARIPIGKAFRGAANKTHGAVLAGHAVEWAGGVPGEVGDVVIECRLPGGANGHNLVRLATIRAGLPVTTADTTIRRFWSSGLFEVA